MGNVRAPAPLRVDLMNPKGPGFYRRPEGFAGRWTPHVVLVVVGVPAAVLLKLGLDRLSPGAGVAVELGFHWLVALAYVTNLALVWRVWERDWIPLRWVAFLAFVAGWFLVRAVLETRALL